MNSLKRYLIVFLNFWYKFIFGDDKVIALTVIWSLLGLYALSRLFINSWLMLPVVVSLLLVWSLKQSQLQYSQPAIKKTVKYKLKPVYFLWILMILIVVIPYDYQYLLHGNLSIYLGNLLLPSLMLLGFILVVALLLTPLYERHSWFVLLCSISATYWLIQWGITKALLISNDIASSHSAETVWLTIIASLGCVATASLLTSWQKRRLRSG